MRIELLNEGPRTDDGDKPSPNGNGKPSPGKRPDKNKQQKEAA